MVGRIRPRPISWAKSLLQEKNRVGKTLSLPCLGDLRVRGRTGVRVVLPDLSLDGWMVVDRVRHTIRHGITPWKWSWWRCSMSIVELVKEIALGCWITATNRLSKSGGDDWPRPK